MHASATTNAATRDPGPRDRDADDAVVRAREPRALLRDALFAARAARHERDEHERDDERDDHRRRDREGERAEEVADDALEERERDEDDDGGEGRADDGGRELCGALARLPRRAGRLAPMRRAMASIMTMASSTTRPIATAMPPSDIRLSVCVREAHEHEADRERDRHGDARDEPRAQIAQKERDHDGAERDAEEDRVAHARHRLADEARLVVDRVDARRPPGGSSASAATAPSAPRTTSGVLAPGRRATLMTTVSPRGPPMRTVRSAAPSTTSAIEPSGTTPPVDVVTTGISRMSASVFGCASAMTVSCCLPSSARPTAARPSRGLELRRERGGRRAAATRAPRDRARPRPRARRRRAPRCDRRRRRYRARGARRTRRPRVARADRPRPRR